MSWDVTVDFHPPVRLRGPVLSTESSLVSVDPAVVSKLAGVMTATAQWVVSGAATPPRESVDPAHWHSSFEGLVAAEYDLAVAGRDQLGRRSPRSRHRRERGPLVDRSNRQ
jgi:hypothetical protein